MVHIRFKWQLCYGGDESLGSLRINQFLNSLTTINEIERVSVHISTPCIAKSTRSNSCYQQTLTINNVIVSI